MTDIKDKVAELEATEKELELKKAELDKVSAETEEAKARKQTEIEALTKEQERVKNDIVTAKEERRRLQEKDASFQDKLRSENFEAAKDKIFSEFGIKPEEQAKFLDEFKKGDSGSVNVDLIYRDMKRTYAFLHADELIDNKRRVDVLSQNSDKFKEDLSSVNFAGAGIQPPQDSEGLTAEDVQAANWSGIPLPKYKELKKKHDL